MEESTPKVTLKKIPTQLEKDIDCCLARYFKNTSKLSSIYWPRALRSFLAVLLNKVKPISELLDKLQWDVTYVDQLISQLESSTQSYICVKDRKQLGNLLRTLKLHWSDYRISVRPVLQSPEEIPVGDPQWPADIANYLDLNTAINSIQMRRDVTTFLHRIMSIASRGDVGYKVVYNIPDAEPDESVQPFYPIRIYTDSAECATQARELFAAESETLKKSVNNLLPADLVYVETTAQTLSGVKSEMYLTCGCPWKVGTLGGVLECNKKPYGVTAQHVQKCFKQAKPFEVVDDNKVEAAVSQEFDFAFFPLPERKVTDEAEEEEDGYINLVAFSTDETTLQVDERVFKVGRSTGWTEGKLSSVYTDYYCKSSRKLFTGHVEVLWTDKQKFAAAGDCGALYCVKRGQFYVPIAIHRVSALEGGFSYGTDFRKALEFFQPEEEKYFRNPPLSSGWETDV